MTIYLVRHGAPDAAENLCIGQHKVNVSADGRRAIQALADTWAGPPPVRLLSSDLYRARMAALSLSQVWSLPIEEDPRLRAMDFGDWDGRSWSEIEAEEGARFQDWMADWADTPVPGGESFADVAHRVELWLRAVEQRHGEGDIVVAVTHAGVIRAALCEVLDLPLDRALRLRADHAHVSSLRTGRLGLEVACVNVDRFPHEE